MAPIVALAFWRFDLNWYWKMAAELWQRSGVALHSGSKDRTAHQSQLRWFPRQRIGSTCDQPCTWFLGCKKHCPRFLQAGELATMTESVFWPAWWSPHQRPNAIFSIAQHAKEASTACSWSVKPWRFDYYWWTSLTSRCCGCNGAALTGCSWGFAAVAWSKSLALLLCAWQKRPTAFDGLCQFGPPILSSQWVL